MQKQPYRNYSLFAAGCLLSPPPGTPSAPLALFHFLPCPGHRGEKVSAESMIDNSLGQEAHHTLEISRVDLTVDFGYT